VEEAGFTMLMPMVALTVPVTIIHNVTPTTNEERTLVTAEALKLPFRKYEVEKNFFSVI
jgi:hypothetical protein